MAEKDDKDNKDTKQAPEPKRPPRKAPELNGDRLSLTEHKHNSWFVHIPHGTELEDLATASYWSHMSHKLRQHDLIECVWEDGVGEATVRVLGSGHGWVKVHVLSATKYPQFTPEQYNTILPGHRVKYVNNFAKWVVMRDSDQRALSDKHDTEGQAYTWLANYAKSLAA